VLVGGGHAHVQVIADWIHRPMPDVDLWVVSAEARSPYSGMVPGWLAGLYDYDEICIDVASLCARAQVIFVEDEMVGMDPGSRRIALRDGGFLDYDVLSLDVGSTLDPPAIAGATVLPLRPLSRLRARWDTLLAERADAGGEPLSVVGVGGGAAGFEALLALHRRVADHRPVAAVLVTRSDRLLPGLARGASRRAARVLAGRGIALRTGQDYDATSPAAAARADVILWATGARPHAWQAACGLATDADGYFRIDRFLRSTSHSEVFACGDCAAWTDPLPKAGVYAVRMGPALIRNLRAAFGDGHPRAYRPQRRHLVLLSTADRQAIASWGPIAFSGTWVWRWKDRIDRRFVDRFRDPARAGQPRNPRSASRES